jgi:hypothetical protein
MESKMQNDNYFGMVKCKIPNFLGLYLVSSKIHNLLTLLWPFETLLVSFPLEATFLPKFLYGA